MPPCHTTTVYHFIPHSHSFYMISRLCLWAGKPGKVVVPCICGVGGGRRTGTKSLAVGTLPGPPTQDCWPPNCIHTPTRVLITSYCESSYVQQALQPGECCQQVGAAATSAAAPTAPWLGQSQDLRGAPPRVLHSHHSHKQGESAARAVDAPGGGATLRTAMPSARQTISQSWCTRSPSPGRL